MQLSLNLGTSFFQPREATLNRIQPLVKDAEQALNQSCLLNLEQLDFQSKYQWLKQALQTVKRTRKQEVKATFYFEEKTKVELPHYFKQLQAEWVTEITLKLTITSEGLWVSKLKNKRAGRSMYDFPLQCVQHVKLEAIEKTPTEEQKVAQLWKRKHAQVWSALSLEEVQFYLEQFECLDLTRYFSQEDLEYAQGCFEWEDEIELQAETKFQFIKLRAQRGVDQQYRAWVLVYDTRRRRLKRYLWLNPTEALFYQEERY